jgi:hypothetical protein
MSLHLIRRVKCIYNEHSIVINIRDKVHNSCNKSQGDALFLKFILIQNSNVSDRSTVHYQESQHCINSNMYLSS